MLDWTKTLSDAAVAPQALSSEATGILIGTRIATNFGWRNVEALCLGDMVLTFDHGFRSIVGLRRVVLWDGRGTCPEFLLPLKIKRGLLENAQPKHVLPMQGVMVESDAAEDYRGDPFAVLMPSAIERYGLAEKVHQSEPLEVVLLEFDEEEVIYGECGLHYFIPKPEDILCEDVPQNGSYKILNDEETLEVLDELYTVFLNI